MAKSSGRWGAINPRTGVLHEYGSRAELRAAVKAHGYHSLEYRARIEKVEAARPGISRKEARGHAGPPAEPVERGKANGWNHAVFRRIEDLLSWSYRHIRENHVFWITVYADFPNRYKRPGKQGWLTAVPPTIGDELRYVNADELRRAYTNPQAWSIRWRRL